MIKISKITRIAGYFIKFFIILTLSVILILKYGIKIDNFEFAGIKLEKLYIKLNKKIIFLADNITLPNLKFSNEHSSSGDFYKLSKSAIWIDRIFEEIWLKDIFISGVNLKILYQNGRFFVDSPYLGVDLKIDKDSDNIDVSNLNFKDFNLSVNGSANADFKNRKYEFKGAFKTHEISGNINFDMLKDELRYKIYDANATSLKNFMNELAKKTDLNKEVKSWIYGYIVASEYSINELNGKINLAKNDAFLDELNAKATARNLKISLDKSVSPISVKDANITLSGSKLSFSLNEPSYQGKKLDGSSLYIYDIFDEKKAGIFINIKTSSSLDSHIHDILNVYDLKIPVIQKSGKTDTNLDLNVSFDTLDVIANGEFKLNNSEILIQNAPFKVKKADVVLKDTTNLYIDAKNLSMDIFNASGVAKLDLNTSKGKIDAKIEWLKIDDLLSLKDQNLKATLDFSGDDTILALENLDTKLKFSTHKNSIKLSNSQNIIKHSKLLEKIGISEFKTIDINTENFTHFDVDALGVKFDLPFYKKDLSKYENDDFKILINKQDIKGETSSGHLSFEVKNSKDVGIKIDGVDLFAKTDENSSFTSSLDDISLILQAKNSNIILNDLNRTLELKEYQLTAKKDFLKLGSNAYGGRVNLSKINGTTTLEARDIDGKFANELFKINSFEGGKFKLKVVGSSKFYKGEVRFYDTYFKDYVFYQQLLTFLNSIPSLISFKTPDFNQKGFSAKSGKVMFEKNGDILNFLAIDIKGSSADIIGAGEINLKDKNINIDLQIEILKDASFIIDKIPIINQILLGKERKLSTLIKLRGTTDKPKYSSQVLKDTLLAPFKMIRNMLEVPFLIFE
ncbi:AsmA-like C-terminal domain-containing protein [Campylobacter mucosalis]|uniref:YhdP family protein n=1 Tax=Campylobacter mucosalis TaxID=202 RepID=UPI00146FF7EE|nr:AsmA-like C-terminal domain-containing protein [Campylobacter mucosalis]